MPHPRLLAIVTVAVLMVAGLAHRAQAQLDHTDWLKVDQLEEAFETARRTNRPVALVYALRNSTCPLHNGCARRWFSDRNLGQMVRVLAYANESNPPQVRQIMSQVSNPGQYVPRLFIVDPQQRIIGFVAYSEQNKTREHVALAGEVMRWQSGVSRQVQAADRMAAAGRFNMALQNLGKIIEQDQAASAKVRQMWGQQPRTDADEAEPGYYFPTLIADKRVEYRKLAAERVAEATRHYEQEDYPRARAVIGPMIQDKADFDETRQAEALMQKIIEAVQSARSS